MSTTLSVASVLLYVAQTYIRSQAVLSGIKLVDFVLAVLFSIDWLFSLWIARNRKKYLISIQSFLDISTIIPVFVGTINEATNFLFLRVLRVFRLLRIFRAFRMRGFLDSEFHYHVFMMGMTLFSILFCAAGIFYELETSYGDRYPDLTFFRSLYWATITVTTVGYGDYVPTTIAAQMVVVVLLLLTLTLIPLQSGKLIDSLSHTNSHMTMKASPYPHVVVMGYFDVFSVKAVIQQLHHDNNGLCDWEVVFLCPRVLDNGIRKVMHDSEYSSSLKYLQGHPSSPEDLARARVESADAIYVLCNHHSVMPDRDDVGQVVTVTMLAQYLNGFAWNCEEVRKKREGRRGKKSHLRSPPRIFIQVLLHRSVRQIAEILEDIGFSQYSRKRKTGEQAFASSQTTDNQAGQQEKQGGNSAAQQSFAAWVCSFTGRQNQAPQSDMEASGEGRTKQAGYLQPILSTERLLLSTWLSKDSLPPPGAAPLTAMEYWEVLMKSLSVVCVPEVKQTMLAQSCLHCPGLMALVTTLVSTANKNDVLIQDINEPEWYTDFSLGMQQQILQVEAFPQYLWGQSYQLVALYIYHTFHAVLLGLCPNEEQGAISLVPVGALIGPHTVGFLITDDGYMALRLLEAKEELFKRWQEQQKERGAVKEEIHQGMRRPPHALEIRSLPLASRGSTQLSQRSRGSLLSPTQTLVRSSRHIYSLQHKDMLSPSVNWEDALHLASAPGKLGSGEVEETEVPLSSRSLPQLTPSSSCAALPLKHHYRLAPERGMQHFLRTSVDVVEHLIVWLPKGEEVQVRHLITSLRRRSWGKTPPVVILSEVCPEETTWKDIAMLEDVFYVKGSINNMADLLRANARSASFAILLTRFQMSTSKPLATIELLEEATLCDAEVMLAARELMRLNHRLQVYSDCVIPRNLTRPSSGHQGVEVYTHWQYAAGLVYSPPLLTNMMCQSLTNQGASEQIIMMMVMGWQSPRLGPLVDQDNSTQDQEGQGTRRVTEESQSCPPDSTALQQECVKLINVLEGFQYYWELFNHLLMSQHCLCLGLYRQIQDDGAPQQVLRHYMYTNPGPMVVLRKSDRVMVLSSCRQPSSGGPAVHCTTQSMSTGS